MSGKTIEVKKLPNGTRFMIGIDDDNGIEISTLERLYSNIQLLGFYDENHRICCTKYRDHKFFPPDGQAWKADITYFPIFSDSVDSSSSPTTTNSAPPNFFFVDKVLVNIGMMVSGSFLSTLIFTLVDLSRIYFDPSSVWFWIIRALILFISGCCVYAAGIYFCMKRYSR